MFGKRFGEYLAFQGVVLALIGVAWALRLGLSLAGLDGVARYASMTTLVLLGPLFYAWTLHKTGFGSFKQLYALCLIQGLFAESLIALAIAIGILTQRDNIFTVPEYYPPSQGDTPLPVDGKNWTHAAVHVAFGGLIVFPIMTWLIGALGLVVVRKTSPSATAAR